VTYLQRFERHLVALAAQIGSVALRPATSDLTALRDLLERAQEEIAAAVAEGRAPAPCPSFDAPLGRLRAQLVQADDPAAAGTVTFLLARLVSDTTSLHFAASTK
jgi:hypothetical protein